LTRLTPSVKEITAEEAERLKKQEQSQNQSPSNVTQSNTNTTSSQPTSTQTKTETKPEEEKKEEGKGEKPNSGNGGSAPRYVWTQKLEDLQMNIPVDEKYRGKDIVINYKSKTLFVGIKNGETIIDGEFPHPIKVL